MNKNIIKKLILSTVSLTTVIAPIATVVACGSDTNNNIIKKNVHKKTQTKQTTVSQQNKQLAQ